MLLHIGLFAALLRFSDLCAKDAGTAKQNGSIAESEGDTLDLFYISTLPWISYSALIQPVPIPADSNPRITWGKFSTRDNRLVLPVSVLCHHALVDGRHLGLFYQALDQALAQLCAAL